MEKSHFLRYTYTHLRLLCNKDKDYIENQNSIPLQKFLQKKFHSNNKNIMVSTLFYCVVLTYLTYIYLESAPDENFGTKVVVFCPYGPRFPEYTGSDPTPGSRIYFTSTPCCLTLSYVMPNNDVQHQTF